MSEPGGAPEPRRGPRPSRASDPILGRVMLAFEGETLPPRIADRLAAAPAAGVTLFRAHNVRSPGQVRELVEAFQHAGAPHGARDTRPMLVAADQEGGQLIALGDPTTAFAGNMALGAVDDDHLTERVAFAIGTEARAMGVNVVYAPCLDVASLPASVGLGIRSFGDDPATVARHGVAFVRGLQTAGVAATVKHAPGMGHAAVDTHHGLAVIEASRAELDAREFLPFRATFEAADVPRLAMVGHAAVPAVSGRADLPGTLSRAIVTDLLRRDLGFEGVTISDALDMGALAQGPGQVLDIVAAIRAGEDLLLASADPIALARIEDALVRAAALDLFDADERAVAARRIDDLRAWLGAQGPMPDLSVIGSAGHRALEAELASRSITLDRDPGGLVASRALRAAGRVVAVMPTPVDRTPADTSSYVAPGLAGALRDYHPDIDAIDVRQRPDDATIAAVRSAVARADLAVIGTIDAHVQPEQVALVEAAVATGTPVIAVAMRGPWDVGVIPAGTTALATYSILPGSLRALAAVLGGEAEASGRLPVAVTGE